MILTELTKEFIKTDEFDSIKKNITSEKLWGDTSIEGISPASFAFIISSLYQANPEQTVIITENSQKMQELYLDLSCFVDESSLFQIPPWETLPYEFVSPSDRIERERITALYKIISGEKGIFITTVESLIRKIPDKKFLTKKGLALTLNDEYPFDDLIEMFVQYGYERETKVEQFGQFSVKGGIIDIFLPSHENPLRLDFFGDTLESIRKFDSVTQKSFGNSNETTVYPRRELILFDKEKEKLKGLIEKSMEDGLEFPDEITNQISSGVIEKFKGIEDLFPEIIESNNILSYFPGKHKIIFTEIPNLLTKNTTLEKIFSELYNKRHDKTLCLKPEALIDYTIFEESRKKALTIQSFLTSEQALQWNFNSITNFHGRLKSVREELSKRFEDGWKAVVSTGFEGQARRLFDLLSEFSPESDFDSLNMDDKLNIIVSPLKEGVEIQSSKTIIISDHEIFGKNYRKKSKFKSKRSKPIDSFLDLKVEDYVVHINHGIGIFRGIERMAAGGVERDFLMIEYNDGDKLYVSLDQINMVQKYVSVEGRKPRIDSLGKKSAWNRIKAKVQQSVEEIAKELIEIYSKRNAMKGFQHPPDTSWQEEFESKFEYEETPDQITVIEDVKDDMENSRPMDRLVCGDVGFGKTEVAIRAAFKSVMAGRQVAILVPTTILAMQHYKTFVKRFAEYPIEIDMMSRFKTRSEINTIKSKLTEGSIDIIIGTHALIAKDVKIKNLGLLIIDEEQKFGVKHKEQLKKLKTLVDVLALSATPIPRTLHMSLAGIRDLSTITTPPENRQAISTYVLEENPDILKKAIETELERDGQIFFVHNRVQTIDAHAELIRNLVPEASICVGHGQMDEHELEEIMLDFLNKKYDILVSTTIIESGLDMPNVNTIIINRADTFGLSQLYQLKGRVGRSTIKAYAYLFYPKHISLTEEAQKRLRVISEYTELGSGFKIAMKDLEIRGSGNILGKEQSGSIMEVGFELYTQMLDDAVRNLKGERPSRLFRTPVFIKTDFFIPETYMNDEKQKIEFYKRLESCESIEEVDSIRAEMIDRFGEFPEEVEILIELERIRAIASSIYIDEILEASRSIRITVSKESLIDPIKLVEEIKNDKRLSIDPKTSEIIIFTPKAQSVEKKLLELKKWLQHIL